MGARSKSTSSLKSATPIPFPHDGPIFHCANNGGTHKDDTSSLARAVQLLVNSNHEVSSTSKLCQSLQGAKTAKEQLHALQSYRCTLLNNKKKRGSELEQVLDEDSSIALYRLLLEWSLSEKSSLPLQRAIQSNLNTIEISNKEVTTQQVLESLWEQPDCWKNNLYALEVAVNFAPLLNLLQTLLFAECLAFLYNEKVSRYLTSEDTSSSATFMNESLVVVDVLKILLLKYNQQQTSTERRSVPFLNEFRKFVLMLFANPSTPTDAFNALGILYGRLLLCSEPTKLIETSVKTVETLDKVHFDLSPLARLSIVQGIAATLDLEILTKTTQDVQSSPMVSCWKYSLRVSQVAADPMVRWGALKGLSTLAGRWKQHQQQQEKITIIAENVYTDNLVQETLQVVLQAWENPPLRKLGTAIPGLFRTLVQLLKDSQIQELCHRVMQQPVNRKGRYLALEILLPFMPAAGTGSIKAESLLDGVGDRGPNTGPIADLWTKLLGHLWNDRDASTVDPNFCFDCWKTHWIPSLSQALVATSLSRRKQVAAFCLPRIVDMMKGDKSLRPHLSAAIVALLDEIGTIRNHSCNKARDTAESMAERGLWAQLEIARHTTRHKLISQDIRQSIASNLPEETLRMALTHSSASIRLVAFQSLEPVVASYSQSMEGEAEMWRYAFPYAVKTTESKEYTFSLLQCLLTFLDRFSTFEAVNVMEDSNQKPPKILPKLHAFVSSFLINYVVVKRGAYPGTVADKEGFTIALVECILAFVTQEQSYSSASGVARNGILFSRRRRPAEIITMEKMLECLLCRETFSSLFGLLHSIWDQTRSGAFRCLSGLVIAAQTKGIKLPSEFNASEERAAFMARGLYLASSPRQREADCGARIMAYLYLSLDSENERDNYLSSLVDLLECRLGSMKDELKAIMKGSQNDQDLPLAHGIIQAIRLAVAHRRLLRQHKIAGSEKINSSLFERMIEVHCQGIKVSLAVVADVRDGEVIEGMEDEIGTKQSGKNVSGSTPLNVNTGAIGANGAFSSVSAKNEHENKERLAIQRIIVGSWLLTKETCAAVAVTVASKGFEAPFGLVEKVGMLLISTLTSLKHAGAAFSARDSLQEIATTCLSSKNSKNGLCLLPDLWVSRLLDEISSNEKVRDSTLRRSTGFALGFVALMRSETTVKSAGSKICPRVLESILRFSLPSEHQIKLAFERLQLSHNSTTEISEFFTASSIGKERSFISDGEYETKCRVHALNVLRLIILDAPLTSVVRRYVGDAIVSSILGYDDPSWAVRNSATMVFSAAMLRVIDADKNASNMDKTSSNAITITELFRRYPPLASFLPSVMRSNLSDASGVGEANSQLFPILLLLSRVQPVADSGGLATTLAQPFIPCIIESLGSRHHAIRAAAARSLANLCAGDRDVFSSSSELLKRCQKLLESSMSAKGDWNTVDGALLAIEALLMVSEKSRHVREMGLEPILFQLIMLESQGVLCPPCCLDTVLKILVTMCPCHDCSGDSMHKFLGACQGIVARTKITRFIGGAKLLATASGYLCEALEQKVWEPTNDSDFKIHQGEIMTLFTSDCIDVRLAAVKTFKKRIYNNIDKLVDEGNSDDNSCLKQKGIIASVGSLLLQALRVEMDRDKRAHVPTIRRISRCFLECVYGYNAIGDDDGKTIFLSPAEIQTLWVAAVEITELELFSAGAGTEPNGETFLSSNAAEMMAVVVSHELKAVSPSAYTNVQDKLSVKVNTFLKVVERLNNPHASWRSRYSAALSLKTSGILLPNSHGDDRLDLRKEALFEVLGMLQDSDHDVRSTAVQATNMLRISDGSHLLPELTLQITYPQAFSIQNGEVDNDVDNVAIANGLLNTILDNCHDLVKCMKFVEEELYHTREISVSASSLQNATTKRKIFEDEDPNPFYEKLLANQLATLSLLKLPKWPKESSSVSLHQRVLLRLCLDSLNILKQRPSQGGMAHEITRFPSIFPGLHGLLCAVSVVIHREGDVSNDPSFDTIQRTSNLVLEKYEGGSKTRIHPDIRVALETVAGAGDGDHNTVKSITDSLFLLR